MIGRAVLNLLTICGPIGWAWMTLSARRRRKAANHLYERAQQHLDACIRLRKYREYSASVCNMTKAAGTEAPV